MASMLPDAFAHLYPGTRITPHDRHAKIRYIPTKIRQNSSPNRMFIKLISKKENFPFLVLNNGAREYSDKKEYLRRKNVLS